MKRICFYSVLFAFVLVACKSSKETISPSQIEALNTLVSSQKFTIESNWAYPQVTNAMSQILTSQLMAPGSNTSAINLIGNANFLTIKGDSITSYLPYFGERQMQVAYGGTDSAIQFNGIMEDFKVEEGKNNRKVISFKADSNSENFNVIITLFPNMKSQIMLRGASRFFIQYTGDVSQIKSEENESYSFSFSFYRGIMDH